MIFRASIDHAIIADQQTYHVFIYRSFTVFLSYIFLSFFVPMQVIEPFAYIWCIFGRLAVYLSIKLSVSANHPLYSCLANKKKF